MYITVKTFDKNDVRLFLQPLADDDIQLVADDYSQTKFVLQEEGDIVLIELELKKNKFDIKKKDARVIEEEGLLSEKLNALAIEVIEAIQQGKDLTEKNTVEEYNPYDPESIRVDTKTFSLRQIFDMIVNGDINLSPDFQRNLVWDDFRKSRLIESVLLRIPLPMFYFSQDEEGVLSVVDGLQRLSAIKEFMENKLKLKDLEYLKKCNNCYYSKEKHIEDKYVRWFNITQITVNIIDAQSPHKVKYDIFRRLNTGGQKLNNQELRNCLAHNNLRKTLREMALKNSFKRATAGSISDVRMDAQELSLRFIYFYKLYTSKSLNSYTGLIDTALDELVEKIGKTSSEELSLYVDLFDTAMKNAYYLFGRQAFRKVYNYTTNESWRSQINKALFVSWSVLLSQYSFKEVKAKNKENSFIKFLGDKISNDNKLLDYLSYGTNGKFNILYAFKSAEEIINEYLKQE